MLKALRDLRERKNLTQRELADLAGVAKSTIGYIESGQSFPRMDTIWRLAVALEIAPVELFQILCEGEEHTMRKKEEP